MSTSLRPCALAPVAMLLCAFVGCANPGPPKPPSLSIPAPVSDLAAVRRGTAVNLQFTLPQRTTDGMTLRAGTMTAVICRAFESGACVPLAAVSRFAVPNAPKMQGSMRDVLPANLLSNTPHLLTYRISFRNAQGKTAGFSDAAYAAAGPAPGAVTGLQARGSRLGVVLSWQPLAGDQSEILLRRENLGQAAATKADAAALPGRRSDTTGDLFGPKRRTKAEPKIVLLKAAGADRIPRGNDAVTLDTNADSDVPYSYTAERKRAVQLGGHKLEMWSEASAPVLFTLHDTFPPPVPQRLSVAGFTEAGVPGHAAQYTVDLIWEPVEDEQLSGYKVYRERVDGSVAKGKELLTPTPIKLPAFRDSTMSTVHGRYKYSVTSIDLKGNESDATSAYLEAQSL